MPPRRNPRQEVVKFFTVAPLDEAELMLDVVRSIVGGRVANERGDAPKRRRRTAARVAQPTLEPA